ncbi:mynd domain containing protein [Grosmannia clavigera kw1407]|uniref:Mynd domain containing protein n=1 Tax=Grosmannia clavigera (strain kw1407 / UAMH 11150) TaxID=655863 RepID=F0XQ49_GROCL|nr:mynd domain containing protein [Grosmannia clavigera kw1407]EFX00235.1 mynd domain containing protein [Grosmannia clavigera kw1407]
MSISSGPGQRPANSRRASLLDRRQQLTESLDDAPYDMMLYLRRAAVYADMGYPDLAAGDAYRALLLTDEANDESFEYHEQAVEALDAYVGEQLPEVLEKYAIGTQTTRQNCSREELVAAAAVRCYQLLSRSLLQCGCLRSANSFCERGLAAAAGPEDERLLRKTQVSIQTAARKRMPRRRGSDGSNETQTISPADLPDRGIVRRELYPWNTHEPDRTSAEAVAFLNKQLAAVAPKCTVRATELPVLADNGNKRASDAATCWQLGVFATEPIAAGEAVLREYSLLTANNRHKESVCDACSSELPELDASSNGGPVGCPECDDTVFCDAFCLEQAQARYHPAVCDKDVDAIAKDPDDARDADDALYVLLLARLLAMATHQERHPLDIDEVIYIWGDFAAVQDGDAADDEADDHDHDHDDDVVPRGTLPFSFDVNIATPLHMLEKMDLDVFAELARYDVWVLNTLYAKFRGTASARKSRRDGRPDVAAVHPLWCLANHDCDPNVTWEWGGRMVLSARQERVLGPRPGGIAAGDEILSHYCDVDLPVQQRREWASGSLGGWCMCGRCRAEAASSGETV